MQLRHAQRGLAHLASRASGGGGGATLVGLATAALTLVVPLSLSLAGCRGAGPAAADTSPVDLTCTLRPDHPAVGPATLSCALRAGGRPIDDATVGMVGLMTHPGMAPLPVTTMARGGGLYDGVFRFTMAGDWALVVTARLPDGRRAERRVDVPGVRAAG